ncbi:hypothetical protein [Paractinoplanes rishiriensis]|nr:hypothetical protein [Actinoplanes rishiriensis]
MADEDEADAFAEVRLQQARLHAYDEALRYTGERRDREELFRMRGLAAVDLLRAAAHASDIASSDVDEELSWLEHSYRHDPVSAWVDPDTVLGAAVTVGAVVLAVTGAAPIAAAVVGESLVKETVKAFVGTMIASALTEMVGHLRQRRISQSAAGQRPAAPEARVGRRRLSLQSHGSVSPKRESEQPPAGSSTAGSPPSLLTKRADEVTRGSAPVESVALGDRETRSTTPAASVEGAPRTPVPPDLTQPPPDLDQQDPPGASIGSL